MKTILRDYIHHTETKNSHGVLHYLDYKILDSSPNKWDHSFDGEDSPFKSYSEIGLESKSLMIESRIFKVSSSIPEEAVRDLQFLHGINAQEMMESVLKSEMEQGIEKTILNKMMECAEKCRKDGWTKFQLWANRWFGYEPKKTWEGPQDLAMRIVGEANKLQGRSRMGGIPFVVVSSEIGSVLQDSQYFTFPPPPSLGLSPRQGIYEIGSLANVKVLVNPSLRYSDREVLMGIKPGASSDARIFMIENPEDEYVSTDVNLSLIRRYGVKSVDSKNYTVFKVAEEGKSHNLFKHLLSKIFKK